jgi:hypothetical protein
MENYIMDQKKFKVIKISNSRRLKLGTAVQVYILNPWEAEAECLKFQGYIVRP